MKRVSMVYLLFSMGVSCASDDALQTGPAGKVVEIEGMARRQRGDEGAVQLQQDDVVYAEDRITTEKGADLAIRLDHNGALWHLRGQRSEIVRESVAWNAQRSKKSQWGHESRTTTVAGRPSERQAGEDSRTLIDETTEKMPPPSPEEESADYADKRPPRPRPGRSRSLERQDGSRQAGGEAIGLPDGKALPGAGAASGGGASPPPRLKEAKKGARRGPAKPVVRRIIKQKVAHLARCTRESSSKVKSLPVTIRLSIGANGRARRVRITGAGAAKACIRSAIQRLAWPEHVWEADEMVFKLSLPTGGTSGKEGSEP